MLHVPVGQVSCTVVGIVFRSNADSGFDPRWFFSLSLSLSLSLSRSIERPKRKMSRLSELQEADCVCVCLGLACLCFFFQGLCKRSGKKSWAPKSCAPNSFCNPEVKSPVQTSETKKKSCPLRKVGQTRRFPPCFSGFRRFGGYFQEFLHVDTKIHVETN